MLALCEKGRSAASAQETAAAPAAKSPAAALLVPRAAAARSGSGGWLLGALLLLLAINALLYWRLYHAQKPVLDMEDLQHRYPATTATCSFVPKVSYFP